MEYPIRTLQQLRPILIGFRKQAGLSQAEVAALLGITQQSYGKIETDPTRSSVERVFTILRLLGAEITISATPTPIKNSATLGADQVKKKHKPITPPAKLTPPLPEKEPW